MDRDRNEILPKSAGKMQDVLKKLAEEKGYDIVVDAPYAPYFKPALDITNDLIAAYDKVYPAAAPAAARQEVSHNRKRWPGIWSNTAPVKSGAGRSSRCGDLADCAGADRRRSLLQFS